MRIGLVAATVAGIGLVVASCAKPRYDYPLPVKADYPRWVYQGSGSFDADGKRVIAGVGSASGIKNLPLAKQTAANRARAEVAKVLQVYSASLMKDYMASTSAGGDASAEEQHVDQAIKTFSAATLSGVTIAEYWIAPDGTAFARAELDFSLLPDLAKKAELDDAVRDYVRQNADKAFGDLEKQEACRTQPGAPTKPAVDILFVIDNSGSMQEEQENLGRNFDAFFTTLQNAGLDYQVGVVTTDVSYEEIAGRLQGSVKVMKPDTANLKDEFKQTVAVGTNGSTEERGLEAMRLALLATAKDASGKEGANAGFLREHARLAVVFVSDEEDQSPLAVSQYTQYVTQLKGSIKRVTLAALVGQEGGCQSENGTADPGLRYIETAKTFGDYGIVESICQADFASALSKISGELREAADQCAKR